MPNLYRSLESLKTFLKTKPNLPKSQRLFIEGILKGDKVDDSFEEIILNRKKEQRELLQKSIQQEISNSSFWRDWAYIRLLKGVLKNIKATQTKEDKLGELKQEIPKKYKDYIGILDTLYLKTANKFHGTLMLPVIQAADSRLADSGGECFGYIAEWAHKIQAGKSPFGVPVDSKPPFKAIKVSSSLWRQYPDLNHLAPLNADISIFQKLQKDTFKLGSKLTSLFGQQEKNMHFDEIVKQKFYVSISNIAEELVQYVDKNPQETINLNMFTYIGGHALGFCKINGKYHFMDSNSGWYRFENSEDFKNWLPFYFKLIKYDKWFAEYEINTYSLSSEPLKPKPKIGVGVITVLIIISPVLLLLIAATLVNSFVVRGVRYLNFGLQNWLKPKENSLKDEKLELSTPSGTLNEQSTIESLPKSLESLDLAVESPKWAEKKQTSKNKVLASMIDTPLKDLASVQERAAHNQEFKQSRDSSFFKQKKTEETELVKKPVISRRASR